MSLKNITSDEQGSVSLAWQSVGPASDEGLDLLDDIWETRLPASASKGVFRKRSLVADEETVPKKSRQAIAFSSSGDEQPAKRSRGATSAAKTNAASLIRSLNGCDSLLLEAQQNLEMFGEDDTMNAIAVATITKLIDKVESKLTAQSVDVLTQGWEAGQPENRGTALVERMKATVSSLQLAKSLAICLQAKPGSEDWGYWKQKQDR